MTKFGIIYKMKVGISMQRYFVNQNNIRNNFVYINGDDYSHITKVMRMKKGDRVIVCNNFQSWLCEIDNFTNDTVVAMIIEELHEKKELPLSITIAHGIVRREKMEEVIDKITQLGANYYIPVAMEYCNAKFNDEKLERKLERMNKIAKEASEQSHRTRLLKVNKPIDFKNFITQISQYDLCLYAYEVISKGKSLKEILKDKTYHNVLILIGPEGGISKKEVEILNQNAFIPISLGPRILRTEVAPSYILAAISYELEG